MGALMMAGHIIKRKIGGILLNIFSLTEAMSF
jgi:hypothetical protein